MIFSRHLGLLVCVLGQNIEPKNFVCQDLLPDDGCGKLTEMCSHFFHANYQCPQTCGKCDGDPLRPINTVGVCYRDSPCYEEGTDGGNESGCSLQTLYPFFVCKCKQFWDGYRCQWYNCPCQNGGNCLECVDNACRQNPICTCPDGWEGQYCEVPVDAKPSLTFGEWSNWNFESCVGNEGKQRMRKRWCSDGSTIKNPKCCYGKLDFCQTPDKVPHIETQICEIQAYWGKWGPWRGNCKTAGTTRQVRGRRCVGGTAGKNQGCKDTIPMRKEVRKCKNTKPKTPAKPTTTKLSSTTTTTKTTTTKVTTTTKATTTTTTKRTTTKRTTTTSKPTRLPTTTSSTRPLSDWLPFPPDLADLARSLPDISNITQPFEMNPPGAPWFPNGPQNSAPMAPPMSPWGANQQTSVGTTQESQNGAVYHFYYQCWPQCLGLKKPYLCIVPSWCAANYAGRRTFWMW